MSTCRIAPKFIMGIVSKAKRQGWTDEQLVEYCNSKGYNAEEVLNWKNKKDSGVVEKIAPVIPVVTQVSRFDGYVSKEDDRSNNIMSYYSEFPEQHIVMKKEFEHDVLSRTYVDITADQVFKNPNKYIPGKGNLLNDELRKLKIEYINQLLDLISDAIDISGFKIDELDDNELKLKKYNASLQLVWDSMKSLKENDNYKKITNLYVKAKYFDELIDSIPFININSEFKNIFNNNHYSFVDGKVKHFTGITSEDASTEDQISNIANILINYIPESVIVNGKIKYIPNTSIGLDAFLSIVSRFKNWIYSNTSTNYNENESLKDFLISEWNKGVNADFGEMMRVWINNDNIGSLEKQKVNTIINVIFGKDSNGKNIAPNNIRDDFSQLIRSTITSSYVEIAYEEIDGEGILTPKTLTERRYLTIKNEYQNYIIASALILSQNPELKNNLFKIDLKTGDDYISFLGDLLCLNLPSFESFDQDNKIANPTLNSISVLQSVIKLIKTLSEKTYESDSEFIKKTKDYLSNSNNGTILNFVKTISLSSKASFKSVIKNSEGNYLPLRQLPSLAYGLNNMYLDINRLGLEESKTNVIINNIGNVKAPLVRSTTINSDGTKSQFRKLTSKEMLREAIEADFLYNLNNPVITEKGKEEYVIRLQSNCFSDKATNTVVGFNISNAWLLYDGNKDGSYKSYDIRKELLNIIKGNENSEKLLLNIWRNHWFLEIHDEYRILASDYRNIFGWEGSDREIINKFNEWGKTHSEKDLISLSYGKVDVVKNVHYIGGKTLQFNPVIQGLIEMLSSEVAFKKYYQNLLNKFGNTSTKKAYLLAHQIFAESYNRAVFGNYYGHDIKVKARYDANGKISNLDELIGSAWTSQTKRLAIVGATYHPYALGKEMGVADKMNIAVIKDEKAYVINNNGELDDGLDSKDGAGDVSPFFSRQANISLGAASAGANKKTIWHFYDYKHNTAGMLKWAEYEITNERMRDSWNSPTKEYVKFKKMHSIPFSPDQKSSLANIVDGFTNKGASGIYGKYKKIIYRDYSTGEYRTINGFNLIYNSDDDTLIGIVNDGTDQIYNIENIFDLFKMLGGPWCYTIDAAGKYVGSESNLDIINEIICKFGLKMNFIAYAVNASGMKTGIKNINETEVLTNDDGLMYFTEDVQYGGLQMDADHTLEEAESTEPSQMIGHVGQDGTSHAKIKKIYNSLSKEISIELSDYVEALDSKDKYKLAELVGRSIVSSFERGDRDTISLAQKFISHASKTGNYNLPFDSSSINNLFTSTLFSDFTKKSAKRKYQGVGAVLNPSYNSKMYYNIGGAKYKFDQVYDMIQKFIKDNNWSEYITVDQILNEPYIYVPNEKGVFSWIVNPYMNEEINHVDINTGMIIEDNPIEIGNEYIIHYESTESGDPQFKRIKIETIEDYLKYRHGYVLNNYGNIKITRNTLAPSNLRGIDATYTIEFNNGLYKVSQIENPYNLAMLHKNGKINLYELINVFQDIDEDILDIELTLKLLNKATEYIENDFTVIRNSQKTFFNNLKLEDSFFDLGVVKNIYVRPTEIMIGRMYAKELGLLPSDNVSDIQSHEFFLNRFYDYYSTNENPDTNSYDAILFDGSGKKLYVKVDPNFSSIGFLDNDDFKIRDGAVYNNSKEVCKADGKKFKKFVDSNGNIHDYVIVDNVDRIQEIKKNNYDYSYNNLNANNFALFGYLNEGNEPISRYLYIIRRNEGDKLNKYLHSLAKSKFFAFKKSLNFVGTRIPCQSMQSFTPMRVIAFTDSQNNEIYIPTHEQWIEGSDYDIDKQYVIGYELLPNGRLITDYKEESSNHIKEVAVKNQIIETILDVISDHKNLTNLTATVSMDNLKKLKDRAESKSSPMDSANPEDIFKMIEENAAGKDTIGITAVAGKAFSAISYYYNGLIDDVKILISNGQLLEALELLKEIPDLPNLDWSWAYYYGNISNEELKSVLKHKFNSYLNKEDAYLLIGEFLNASADNAKALILKKINANGEWADLYIAGIMLGYSLNDIFNIMTDPKSIEFMNSKSKPNIGIRSDKYYSDRKEAKKVGGKFLKLYETSMVLQLIGSLAGINQGFPNNNYEISKKISQIKNSAEKVLNWNVENKEDRIKFDVFKFFLDANYRLYIINIMESTASASNFINPFKIIYNHPLFRSQWTAFLMAIQTSNTLSKKNSLEYAVGVEAFMSKEEYNRKVFAISKSMDLKWLENSGFTFTMPSELEVEKSISTGTTNITPSVAKLFIKYMEKHVIPTLKASDNYYNNAFIKSLSFGIKNDVDFIRLEIKPNEKMYYRIPLNMMEIDSDEKTRKEYGRIFAGFNALSGIKFEGNYIQDLFYIYEILTNKSLSQSSLSRFFSESFDVDTDSIINKHAYYIGEINEDDVVKSVNIAESISSNAPSIYDYESAKQYYYNIESANISVIDRIPEFAKNGNIVIFNDDNYLEVLHKEGINGKAAENIKTTGRAFVYNGKIFINTDKSNRGDIRHELAHIMIGILKSEGTANDVLMNFYNKNKDKFAKIMIELSDHKIYNKLNSSDLIEETIAHYVALSESNFEEFINSIPENNFIDLEFIFTSLTSEDSILKVQNMQKTETFRNYMINRYNEGEVKMSVNEDCK